MAQVTKHLGAALYTATMVWHVAGPAALAQTLALQRQLRNLNT